MKILLPAVLILALILTGIMIDACRVTPRIYYTGDTALVLTVYDVPVFVFVQNDPNSFVTAHRHRNAPFSRTVGRTLPVQ